MSKLINKTRLQEFATGLWGKIKQRYDVAFKGVTLTDDKKLKFTKIEGADTVDVDLVAYARLQDRNEFVQDVSVDNVSSINNINIGTINGNTSSNRILGHRDITSKSFVDGYVSDLVVFTDTTLQNGTSTNWRVWAIKKGATRNQDTVFKIYHTQNGFKTADVETMTLNGEEQKIVKFTINEKFAEEVYFMVQCPNNNVRVIHPTGNNLNDNVVNMSAAPNNATGSAIQWTTNATNNTAIMYLFGRESIKSLYSKIEQVKADGSQYVKVTDTTDGTGTGSHSGKVLKLGDDGKIKKEVLPAIALNEFITITSATFNENALTGHEYQNGDVIFNSTTQKRYLCIDRDNATFANRFIELNDKTGVVTAVNGENGDVTLSVVEEGDVVKVKANNVEVGTINAITQQEITEILNTLS